MSKKIKTLILFSGGLDSILTAKMLKKQGIETTLLAFQSCFFDAKQAQKAAKNLKAKLKIVDFSNEHLEMVKRPKYGYGKAMNPCIDCHILMLKEARKIMKKGKFDFVATGEVLGERPMSQNRKALEVIEKESGLKDYLLRPLSAKLLKPTIPEKKDWVDRKRLFDFSGRSRKKQLALVKEMKIKRYPTPAGGCLLTDLEFGKKLNELSEIYSNFQENDVEILKLGRHFWRAKSKIVVGRNEREDKELKKLIQKDDILIEMENYPGPITLIRNYSKAKIPEKIIEKAKSLTQYYSTKARDKKDVKFKIK